MLFTVFGNIKDPQLHVYLVDPAGGSYQNPLLSSAVPKTHHALCEYNVSRGVFSRRFRVISRIHSCMSTWLILPVFNRSTVPPFNRSTVQPFSRSAVQPFWLRTSGLVVRARARARADAGNRSTVFARSTARPFNHSTVQFFSTLQPFNRSTVQPFDRSTVQPSDCSTVQPIDRSPAQPFNRSTVQPFDRSTVFNRSTVQPFDRYIVIRGVFVHGVFGNSKDPQLHAYLVDPTGRSSQSLLVSITISNTQHIK